MANIPITVTAAVIYTTLPTTNAFKLSMWTRASAEEILADYPDLEAEDIRACLAYASRYLDHSVLVAA